MGGSLVLAFRSICCLYLMTGRVVDTVLVDERVVGRGGAASERYTLDDGLQSEAIIADVIPYLHHGGVGGWTPSGGVFGNKENVEVPL